MEMKIRAPRPIDWTRSKTPGGKLKPAALDAVADIVGPSDDDDDLDDGGDEDSD